MKRNSIGTLLFSVTVTLSGLFFVVPKSLARSVDPTPIVATVTGSENGVASAAYLADGRLLIVKEGQPGVQVVKLPASAQHRLDSLAAQVTDAPLKKKTRTIVCRTLVPIMQSLLNLEVSRYDATTQQYTSDMRLVQTGEGCSYMKEFTPKNAEDRAAALQLRTALALLATTLVK